MGPLGLGADSGSGGRIPQRSLSNAWASSAGLPTNPGSTSRPSSDSPLRSALRVPLPKPRPHSSIRGARSHWPHEGQSDSICPGTSVHSAEGASRGSRAPANSEAMVWWRKGSRWSRSGDRRMHSPVRLCRDGLPVTGGSRSPGRRMARAPGGARFARGSPPGRSRSGRARLEALAANTGDPGTTRGLGARRGRIPPQRHRRRPAVAGGGSPVSADPRLEPLGADARRLRGAVPRARPTQRPRWH